MGALVVAVVAPRSGPCREPIIHEKMADQLVEQLKATVDKLENRVNELETRLHGGSVAVKPGEGQGMRMILIGPPGAAIWPLVTCSALKSRRRPSSVERPRRSWTRVA